MGERLAIVQRIILSEDAEFGPALDGLRARRPKISRGCWKRWMDCP